MPVFYDLDAQPPLTSRWGGAAAALIEAADERVSELAGRVRIAYLARFAVYQERLREALGDAARHGLGGPRSAYPEVSLKLDGTEATIVLDENLYTSLFDLYVVYGSQGLMDAGDAVRRGGGERRDLVWPHARAFFGFTRNALVLLIRETLIGIEAAAASSVCDRLGQVQRRIATALDTELRFELIPEHKEVVIYSDVPVKVPVVYKLKDRPLAKALTAAMHTAVDARHAYDGLVAARQKVERELDDTEAAVANETSPGWTPSPSPGGEPATARRRRAELKARAIEADLSAAMTKLHDTQRQVHVNVPFALLVLPGLSSTFDGETMEDALGTALFALDKGVDRLAGATRPGASHVRGDLRGLRGEQQSAAGPIDPRELEELYLPDLRIEHALVSISFAAVSDDPSYVALLHGDTWRELIRNDVIGRDSFEYVVAYHWLAAIDQHAVDAARRNASITRVLAIASSGFSLLALAAPPLAGLALAADLALLAFTAHSAMSQLAGLDEKLSTELPALAGGGYEALAAAGELTAQLASLREHLTLEVLTQLATLPLQRIRSVGELLKANFYVNDAVTLLRESGGQRQ